MQLLFQNHPQRYEKLDSYDSDSAESNEKFVFFSFLDRHSTNWPVEPTEIGNESYPIQVHEIFSWLN